MAVVRHDSLGLRRDLVAPAGQNRTLGPHAMWGSDLQAPALVLLPHLRRDLVTDHAECDATSVLGSIERGLRPMPPAAWNGTAGDLCSAFGALRC